MQAIPYLSFNGNCAEAMRFYAQLLGAELNVMTFGDMPPPPEIRPAGCSTLTARTLRKWLMHCE